MWFFTKKINIDYNSLISTLERGDKQEILELLWQPKRGQISYLPATYEMLQKFKKPSPSARGLSIYKQLEKGNYELIIFHLPWDESDLPYSPVILDKTTGKVVGILLTFNELYDAFSKKQHSDIGELGTQWIQFTLAMRS